MGISWAEGLGYVFQGAAEGSEKIREEKLAQRFELMKEDKQTINEIAKTRYATDLATFNEETKKVKSIESALANIKNANNGKGMDKYNAALQLIMADKDTFAMYQAVPDTEKTAFVTQYTQRFEDIKNDEGEVTGFTVNYPTRTLTAPKTSDYFKGTEFWQQYADEIEKGTEGPLVKQVKKLFGKKITDSAELEQYVKESQEIGGTTIVGDFKGEPVTSNNTNTANLFKSESDLVWTWEKSSDVGAIKYKMVETNYNKIVSSTTKGNVVAAPILALDSESLKDLKVSEDGTVTADGDAQFLLSQTAQLYDNATNFLRDAIIWNDSEYPNLRGNSSAMTFANQKKIFNSQWEARTITLDNEKWFGGGTVDGKYLIDTSIVPMMIDENFNAVFYNDEVMGIIEANVNEFIAGKEGSLQSLSKDIDNVIRTTIEQLKKEAKENENKNLELESTGDGDKTETETETGSTDNNVVIGDITQDTFNDFNSGVDVIKKLSGKKASDGKIYNIEETIAKLEEEGFIISDDIKVVAPLVKAPKKYLDRKPKQQAKINPEWNTWVETQLPLWQKAIGYLDTNFPQPEKSLGKGRYRENPEWTTWNKKYGSYYKEYETILTQVN